jgi:hypothetical protein
MDPSLFIQSVFNSESSSFPRAGLRFDTTRFSLFGLLLL